MFEKLKKEKKYLLLLFILITLISLMCFFPSLSKNVPITFGTDLKPQWFEFYTEFKNLIFSFFNNKELPFYSWNLFLGNNFWGSKSYYLIGDIYNYIGLLFNDNFFDVARNLTYLKFLVSGFSFYLYLTELDRKPISKIITSLCYTFSGWAIFFSGQMVFLSFYSIVPLYLLGMEKCLKNKSPILFMLSSALLFSTNFYFFYTLTIFSPLIYIYRYFELNLDKKLFWKKVFQQIIYYIGGILITAVFWLPGVFYILGSDRFLATKNGFDIFTYLNYFFSIFTPNYLYIYRNNAFETNVHYTREICMWFSSALLVLIPQFLYIYKDKEKKNRIIFSYALLFLIGLIPFACSLVHGFGDPSFRWVFIFVIFNLFIISDIIDKFEMINNKVLIRTMIVEVLTMFMLFFLAILLRKESLSLYFKQLIIIIVSTLMMIASCMLVICKNKKMLLVLVTLELGLSGMYCYGQDVYSKPDDTYPYMEDLTHVIQNYPGEVMDVINEIKPENGTQFIRVYVPHDSIYWNFSHNMSVHYGIKGLMTYDSTFASSFISMREIEPSVTEFGSGWIFNIKDYDLMTFLNTKYAIVTEEDSISENWTLVNDDYMDGLRIYENNNYRPLGTTYSKIMTEEEYKNNGNTSLFLDYVISDDNYEEIKEYVSDANGETTEVYYVGNYLNAKYSSDKDGFMVLTIPYDEGWNISIDGEPSNYYECNGGFIGMKISEGQHEISMSFIPKGFKLGLLFSVIGFINLFTVVAYRIFKKKKYNCN